jgi:hypothetical protein
MAPSATSPSRPTSSARCRRRRAARSLQVRARIRWRCRTQRHHPPALPLQPALVRAPRLRIASSLPCRSPTLRRACQCLLSPPLAPHGHRVHRHLLASAHARLTNNIVLINHLITMCGRCAAPDAARVVFDGMPDKNPVSCAAVIAVAAHA